MPILFCNISWMKNYCGIRGDSPKSSASYIKEHGTGSEIHNFNSNKGVLKGFVQVAGSMNLRRLGATDDVESLKSTTVVWVAPSPVGVGNVIVGWYQNATVLKNVKNDSRFPNRHYNIVAKQKDSSLLPIDKRTFLIPRGEGGMGESNIWYAEKQPKHFRESVLRYIKNGGNSIQKKNIIGKSNSLRRNPDPLKRQKIEEKAICVVSKYFSLLGYEVKSFEKDNVGWDLQAHLSESKFLRLEVKGLSGKTINIELTPNEFVNMKKHCASYRICVVTNALKKPTISIFSYSSHDDRWEDDKNNRLRIKEIVGARIDIA